MISLEGLKLESLNFADRQTTSIKSELSVDKAPQKRRGQGHMMTHFQFWSTLVIISSERLKRESPIFVYRS